MHICENCNNEHNGLYGSGRFCSKKCARGFSTKNKRIDINEKVSKKLKGRENKKYKKEGFNKICPHCKKTFYATWRQRKKICCSISCATKLRGGWTNHKKINWSEINKKSYLNGHNYVAGGTTKWFDYNNIKVQGTYELRVCKILDIWKKYNIIKDWEYTNDKIEYIGEDNKKHTYLLDFKVYTNDGFNYYIEVKGYKKPNDLLKWKAVIDAGNKLEVWFEKDISKIENNL